MLQSLTSPPLEAKFTPFALDDFARDGQIEGYASVFDETDLARDVVRRGAFVAGLRERGARAVKMLFQHDPKEIVGVWLDIAEDTRGLRVKGRLLTDIRRGAELLVLLRERALDGLSIGFRTIEGRTDARTGIRHLHKVDLWEISLVTFPMLPAARVAGFKGRAPSEREFERWLMRDAGFTRSQAKAVIARGYKAATGGRDALPCGPTRDARLVTSLRRAASLCKTPDTRKASHD
jgi:hypothetical protein